MVSEKTVPVKGKSGTLAEERSFLLEAIASKKDRKLCNSIKRGWRAKKSGGDFVATNFSRAIATNNQSSQNS